MSNQKFGYRGIFFDAQPLSGKREDSPEPLFELSAGEFFGAPCGGPALEQLTPETETAIRRALRRC